MLVWKDPKQATASTSTFKRIVLSLRKARLLLILKVKGALSYGKGGVGDSVLRCCFTTL